jgi:hypothetical protein
MSTLHAVSENQTIHQKWGTAYGIALNYNVTVRRQFGPSDQKYWHRAGSGVTHFTDMYVNASRLNSEVIILIICCCFRVLFYPHAYQASFLLYLGLLGNCM